MSRVFPGGAVADRVTYDGVPIPYSARHSWAGWVYRTSNDTSALWRLRGDSFGGGNRWTLPHPNRLYLYAAGVYQCNWSWATPPLNAWYHLAFTHDVTVIGTAPIVYVNGVSQALTLTDSWGTAISTGDSFVRMGNGPTGNLCWFGSLQNDALWNDILSAAEIQALAKGVSPHLIRTGKLVAHWPLLQTAAEGDWAGGRAAVIVGTTTAPALVPSGPMIVV